MPESYLLKPSLDYCRKRLAFSPDIVVGDMGYIHHETKRHFRTKWNIAVLTKMKADLAEFEAMLHSALKSSEVRSASTHAEESVLRARARGAQKGAKPLGYS